MYDVCHISTTFNRGSGSARRTLAIAEFCHRQGLSTLLVFGPDNDMERYDGPVEWRVARSLHKSLHPARDIAAYRELRELLAEASPRLVHTHLAKAGILGRLAATGRRRNGAVVLHTVHGPTFDRSVGTLRAFVYRTLERLAARYTDVMVYVGEDLRRQYTDAGIAARRSELVVRTGKAIAPTAPKGRRPRDSHTELRLVYVARLVPMKQHVHAIDLLGRLVENDVPATLELVGEALVASEKGYASELRRHVETAGLASRVTFSGHVDDVPRRLAESDVALLVSRYEGLPNAVVEALLAGTPIVAYDVSGVREVLGEELRHLAVPVDDQEALLSTVADLAADPGETRAAVMRRSAVLRELYGMEAMLERKATLYRDLLGEIEMPAAA